MPIFDRLPECFPPVIEPVVWLGDVPAFAWAEGDAVVAWTPPKRSKFIVSDSMLSFVGGNEELTVHVMRREHSAKATEDRHRVCRARQATTASVARMTTTKLPVTHDPPDEEPPTGTA